jgi:ribosome-associated protein
MLHLAPGISCDPSSLTVTQSRSGGPGGQHVNTTASQVEMRLALDALVGLSPAARERLERLAGSRLTGEGVLVLHSDETRSARRNRELAWERLCALVLAAATIPRPRRATKPTRASRQRRLTAKAHQADRKRDRRPGE